MRTPNGSCCGWRAAEGLGVARQEQELRVASFMQMQMQDGHMRRTCSPTKGKGDINASRNRIRTACSLRRRAISQARGQDCHFKLHVFCHAGAILCRGNSVSGQFRVGAIPCRGNSVSGQFRWGNSSGAILLGQFRGGAILCGAIPCWGNSVWGNPVGAIPLGQSRGGAIPW